MTWYYSGIEGVISQKIHGYNDSIATAFVRKVNIYLC